MLRQRLPTSEFHLSVFDSCSVIAFGCRLIVVQRRQIRRETHIHRKFGDWLHRVRILDIRTFQELDVRSSSIGSDFRSWSGVIAAVCDSSSVAIIFFCLRRARKRYTPIHISAAIATPKVLYTITKYEANDGAPVRTISNLSVITIAAFRTSASR